MRRSFWNCSSKCSHNPRTNPGAGVGCTPSPTNVLVTNARLRRMFRGKNFGFAPKARKPSVAGGGHVVICFSRRWRPLAHAAVALRFFGGRCKTSRAKPNGTDRTMQTPVSCEEVVLISDQPGDHQYNHSQWVPDHNEPEPEQIWFRRKTNC